MFVNLIRLADAVANELVPVTPNVDANDTAPVTPRVPPTVTLDDAAKVVDDTAAKVEAPVALSVPFTSQL